MRKLLNDEAGFILSAELMIIITLVTCCTVVGMVMIRDSLVQELGDVSEALGSINQSFNYRGVQADNTTGDTVHATCSGSGFSDDIDDCDTKGVSFPVVCGRDDPSDLDTDE